MSYSVYCHTFPDGKKYIGITSQNPEKRWNKGQGYKKQKVYKAISKFGWENIKHEVLFSGLSKEEAEFKERCFIKEYNTIGQGWNVDTGGEIHTSYLCKDLREMYSTLCRYKWFDASEREKVKADSLLCELMNFTYEKRSKDYILSDPVDCVRLRCFILDSIMSFLDYMGVSRYDSW